MACIDLLIWVGQPKKKSVVTKGDGEDSKKEYRPSRYHNIEGYIREAMDMGCCRRIPQLPEWVVPGESRVFLVHKGEHKRQEYGSIFGYFIVKRIEYITPLEGPAPLEQKGGKVAWSPVYFTELKSKAAGCRGGADQAAYIRNKLPKRLTHDFPRKFSRKDIRYENNYPPRSDDPFEDLVQELLKEYIDSCLRKALETYHSGDFKIVAEELAALAGGMACSKRHVAGAVYLVNELYAAILDAYEDKFYHWLYKEGKEKYPGFSREQLLHELYKTEQNPKKFYPEEGIEVYRQAKAEVLMRRIPKTGKLILLKKPYPVFCNEPSAAFRGYRRIDGDMLMQQIEGSKKQVTPIIPYCSDKKAEPGESETMAELEALLSRDLGIKKITVHRLFEELKILTIERLHSDKTMLLPGLGKLVASVIKEHYTRNIATGEMNLIPKKKIARFKASKEVKEGIQ